MLQSMLKCCRHFSYDGQTSHLQMAQASCRYCSIFFSRYEGSGLGYGVSPEFKLQCRQDQAHTGAEGKRVSIQDVLSTIVGLMSVQSLFLCAHGLPCISSLRDLMAPATPSVAVQNTVSSTYANLRIFFQALDSALSHCQLQQRFGLSEFIHAYIYIMIDVVGRGARYKTSSSICQP
ncbi:unnamed protein product [Somion occarium]|uniref:Uncharacterized protein n=1 Tax=Somion occarium TaxID=3059160 RepID=A0ABP1DF47_9APHY